MSRIKTILVLLFTMIATSAIATASAPAFTVEECANVGAGKGKYEDSHCTKEGGEKKYEWQAVASETLTLASGGLATLKSTLGGLSVDIDCTQSKSTGHIRSSGLNLDEITYENCQFYELKSGVATLLCAIPNITAHTHGELVTGPKEKYKPESGENFTTIALEGCPKTFPKKVEVKGEITCELPESEVDAVEHEVLCTEADSGLKLGLEEASFIGTEKVKLQNGAATRLGPPAPGFKGPSWQFEGARLESGEEKTVSTGGGTFKIRSISGEVKIECTGASGSGDIIGSAKEKVGTDHNNKLEFTGCADKAEKGCEIVSFANGEKEERTAGKIGPVSISTELVFPGNTGNRTDAGDLFLPQEENTEAKFGAGAPETVFVVLELRKKGAEACAPTGKRFSLLAAPAGGPAAELKIAKKSAKSGEQAEVVELSFPATQFEHVEKWTGAAYKIEPIELQWINQSKALQTLEIEGTLTLTMTGKKFGWSAS